MRGKRKVIKEKEKGKSGFTLIELILYVGIVSIVLTALIPFAWNLIEGGVKSSTDQEVYSQGRYASEAIKYEIRNANSLSSFSSSSITLIDSSGNNVIITSSAGKITLKRGAANAVNLNSNDTSVTGLIFTNYTSADNKTKNIQFTFTIDDAFASSRTDYQAPAINIEGDGEIRSN